MALEDLFANSSMNVSEMLGHLEKTAKTLNLPFGKRTKTYNSRLAQELGLWAESKDKGQLFHHAAFHAYFAEGKNLALEETLLTIAESVGLEKSEVKKVVGDRLYTTEVDADWQLSKDLGITSVPTFVLGQQKLVGAQPYHELERFVMDNDVPGRKSPW